MIIKHKEKKNTLRLLDKESLVISHSTKLRRQLLVSLLQIKAKKAVFKNVRSMKVAVNHKTGQTISCIAHSYYNCHRPEKLEEDKITHQHTKETNFWAWGGFE